jgi:hypothetical protein
MPTGPSGPTGPRPSLPRTNRTATVVASDQPDRDRSLPALRYLLHRLPYTKKDLVAIGPVDPLIVGRPSLVPSMVEDDLAATSRG